LRDESPEKIRELIGNRFGGTANLQLEKQRRGARKPRAFILFVTTHELRAQGGGWLRSGWAYPFVRLAPDINKKPRTMPGGSDLET
jgi:hypothetical protein